MSIVKAIIFILYTVQVGIGFIIYFMNIQNVPWINIQNISIECVGFQVCMFVYLHKNV